MGIEYTAYGHRISRVAYAYGLWANGLHMLKTPVGAVSPYEAELWRGDDPGGYRSFVGRL